MFSTLIFPRRTRIPFLFRSSSVTAVDSSALWLSCPSKPHKSWPPQPPTQFSGDSPLVPSFSHQDAEKPSTSSKDSAANFEAITSLLRSTPLSDLKSTLPFLSPSLLSSTIDHLTRSHSFHLAWSLLLSHPPSPLTAFSPLFRRYARAQKPSDAIRAFLFLRRHPHLLSPSLSPDDDLHSPLELLFDALCKEGHPRAASDFLSQLKTQDPNWMPSIRCHNILLHGWFRLRKLKKAERLWSEMLAAGISPTVVSYGTFIEGLCRLRRPDHAMGLLEEMRASGIDPNFHTCNPIVDSLSEAGRFKEALGFVERFPLFGISPNISTYNSLIKGFCKSVDLKGASSVLKSMIARGILPTSTTYNYFFRFFAKFSKIEEGMNLYNKIVQSGYAPDQLTYQLLIKMLCEKERLDLAVQLIKEMNRNGFELDLAMSTMLVHLLCRLRKYEEACNEFEEMFKRGIVPQYITYRKLSKELKRLGFEKREERLSALMDSVPHSKKLPETYRENGGGEEAGRRKSILQKAQAMSDALKEYRDKDGVTQSKASVESVVEVANKLMTSIRRRVYAIKDSV